MNKASVRGGFRQVFAERFRGLMFAALVLTATGRSGIASGAEDVREQAKVHYLKGQNHYNLNEFDDALREFKEAYRIQADPVFLFNIGQCARQLDQLDEAIKFYRSYLRNKPDASNRSDVEHKIEELKGLIEARKTATHSAPLAVLGPGQADGGSGKNNATAGHAEPAKSMDVAPPPPPPAPTTTVVGVPTAPTNRDLAAAPATPVADLTSSPSTESEPAQKPIYTQWWFWAGAGAVVVLGVVLGVALSGGSSPPSSQLGTQKVF